LPLKTGNPYDTILPMAVALRLFRLGKKGHPIYRIIAIDKRKKRNGNYIEAIGSYHPGKNPFTLEIKEERFAYWKEKGAHISEGLHKLLKSRKKS